MWGGGRMKAGSAKNSPIKGATMCAVISQQILD